MDIHEGVVSLRQIQDRVDALRRHLSLLGVSGGMRSACESLNSRTMARTQAGVFEALARIQPNLAESYAQVTQDLADRQRSSWAGTAHELREVLRAVLEELAPDDGIKERPWYRQEPGTTGPTHRQRAKYILEKRGLSSKEMAVVEELSALDGVIAGVVRATYNRASDAAHRSKTREEVARILRYFDACAHDLLDIAQTDG